MKFFAICVLSQLLMFLNFLIYIITFGRLETAKWTESLLCKILDVKFEIGDKEPELDQDVKIVLCNHRSFGDFLIDSLIVGHCSHLSRFAVIFALPLTALYALATGRVLYFRRDKTRRKALSQLVAQHFKRRDLPLIIYPEGHRNMTNKSLPIKVGALKIAYEGQYVLQCVITTNKELVLNEKSWSAKRGVTCQIFRSNSLNPKHYPTFEAFLEKAQNLWAQTWERAQQQEVLGQRKRFYPKTSAYSPL